MVETPGLEDEKTQWWNPIRSRYSDLIKPAKRGWLGSEKGGGGGGGSHFNLLCHLLPSSSPPVSTPLPMPCPLPVEVQMRLKAAMWLPAVTDSLSDCPSVCPFVCSFNLCVCVRGPVRASAEDWTELLWSVLGGCGALTAVALRVFRKDKKRWQKKKRF